MPLMSNRWRPGPARPRLGEREVHVWRSSLDLPGEIRSRLEPTLSQEERERASRFATDELRNRYIAGRGILRDLLGSYLGKPSGDLQFRYGEHEKPFLVGDATGAGLQFNVSHSRDLALFALSLGREIGVDVEWIRPDITQADIASRFFSTRESAQLLDLPDQAQCEYFYALWTCKEAFVKAQGGGLSFGLSRFDVELVPGDSSAVIVSNGRGQTFSPWFAQRLEPGSGYAGAVAVEERESSISLWEWPSAE